MTSVPDKFVCLDFMTPEDEEARRVKEEEFGDSDANRFRGADKDGDGKLTKEEFPAFLYPEHHDFMADHVAGVCVFVCLSVCMCLGVCVHACACVH